MNSIKQLRTITNMSQAEFADYLHIPKYNIQNWEQGNRCPLDYVLDMIERIMVMDKYDLSLFDLKSHVSKDHKITYYFIPKQDNQYDAVFYYKNIKYLVELPHIANFPKEERERLLLFSSSCFVDDKIDEIKFFNKVKSLSRENAGKCDLQKHSRYRKTAR